MTNGTVFHHRSARTLAFGGTDPVLLQGSPGTQVNHLDRDAHTAAPGLLDRVMLARAANPWSANALASSTEGVETCS